MKRKIRHALVAYTSAEGTSEIAFRGQIVDIPDEQVERLDELNATVDPDLDLQRPGTMMALPETASDAEIMSWVIGATNEELESLVRERPVMATRIEAAKAAVEERFDEQNLHLGGLLEIAEEAEAAQAAQVEADADLIGAQSDQPAIPLDDAAADELVAGKATDVAEHISVNPHDAAILLAAEGRRAEAAKEDPRVTVVKAAEAAAGFTQ